MLTKVHRDGPSRQRLLKGFVVAGGDPKRIIDKVAAGYKSTGTNLALCTDPRFPASVWLDTGMVWLHTPRARQACFSQLASAVQLLSQRVRQTGGQLLPNAVRPVSTDAWDQFVCSDRHFLEVSEDAEKEVYCNLLRTHLPVLVALTGRAGTGPDGIEPLASRRLCDSGHHLAARYLASVSSRYLQRVIQCLRRDQGVGRLDLLDICPVQASRENPGSVEIRFTDGQVLLATARAHALLYQALLIRARWLVRNGRRVGNVPQGLIERNRVRAIADGLQARLEEDRERDDRGGKQGPRSNSAPHSMGRDRNRNGGLQFSPAREKLLDLLETVLFELQDLEVEFAELAPLVLGTGLRAMGIPGLENESDMLRELQRRCKAQNLDFLHYATAWIGEFAVGRDDALTAMNRELYPKPCERVQRWWDLMLRMPLASEDRGADHATPRRDRNHDLRTRTSTGRIGTVGTYGQPRPRGNAPADRTGKRGGPRT